jgi:ribosomal protein S27AE
VIALASKTHACPRCGYHDVRLSRRRGRVLLRLLGLRWHRCLACGLVVLAPNRQRVRSTRAIPL